MNIETCFDTLCISRDASLEEAKRSYKQLVKLWHPDQYGNDPEKQEIAQKKLTEINVAYREIVALMKYAPPSAGSRPESKQSAGHSENLRTPGKSASFFQRMSWIFKNRTNIDDADTRQPFETGRHAARRERGPHPGSAFRKELKRAIRSHRGRSAMGPPGEDSEKPGRRRNVGCAFGGGGIYRMPSTTRRNRGDRVEKIEKIRPVRRVGKIGE
jgi:DnaJ-class molecular chaperone